MLRPRVTWWVRGSFLALFLISGRAETTVHKTSYHSWPESLVLANGVVEAVIVPAVGRVMQFRFSGDANGPLWENRALDGKNPDPQSSEWINFGGDKSWPAPQSEWAKITGRGWPPPKAFDSMPVEAEIAGDTVVLRSKIDPSYGIRVERRIKLSASEPVMEIETIYRKLEGPPIRVSLWVITQLNDPEKMFLAVPPKSLYAAGYTKQSDLLPANLRVAEGILTCTRSPAHNAKIGSDSGDLFWADAQSILHIRAPREPEGEFPDNGSSAEIYTNSDPNRYIELETLGPLKQLRRGDSLARRQSYRLHRRTTAPLDEQVRSLFPAP